MKSFPLQARPTFSKNTLIAGILSIFIVLGFTFFLPPSEDWSNLYRPAAAEWIAGRNPYAIERFTNAPWSLLPMVPLLILPEALGRAVLAFSGLIALSWVVRKFGASLLGLSFFLLSPPVVSLMLDGNIDWLVAIGFILPPQIGLFFIAIKPQIGIAVAVFWFIQAWQSSGLRGVVKVFAPVTIALIASFILYGLWPMKYLLAFSWGGNTSLWPMSLPIGLALLVTAIRKQNISYAIAASPCFSPYLLTHSWIGPLIALAPLTPELIATTSGFWLLMGIWALR